MTLQPRFEEQGAFFVVGYSDYGAFAGTAEIPALWDRFIEVMDTVPHRVNPAVSYGVEFYDSDCMTTKHWNYMAAVEVSTLEAIPLTMVGKVIPARLYAVFTYRGTVDGIATAFRSIYDSWLPDSGYIQDGPFDFERYDERFIGDVPESEIDIYIPVRAQTTVR